MPTYELRCEKPECLHEFEVLKSVKDYDREEPCPLCGAIAARRFTTTNPVHFKGGGWHNTDYGKRGPK